MIYRIRQRPIPICITITIDRKNMRTPALKEIKQELESLPASRAMELFLHVIKSRKENKELVSYLLFESHNQAGYIESIKEEINEAFTVLPAATKYLTKKALRKILQSLSKFARHMRSKQAEVDILVHFCRKLKASDIRLRKSPVLGNIYLQQIKKINGLVELLHEDLRHDYKKVMEEFE